MIWLLWIMAAVITAISVGLLLHPLLRRRGGKHSKAEGLDRSAYDMSIYRDQLAEIEKDQARGVLSASEAGAARLEVQRRLLAADRRRETTAPEREAPRRPAIAFAALAIFLRVPLGAAGLYIALGQPSLPSMPYASRGAEFERTAEMREMTDQLRLRLAQDGEDPRGRVLLARAERELGEWQEAAEAYREAVARTPRPSADLQAALGEAITMAAGGSITREARAAFDQALAVDPADPRARYYKALHLQQSGHTRDALDLWLELAETTPRDAGWRPLLHQQIVAAAEELGLSLADLKIPEGPPVEGPGAGEAEAAMEDMSPEERQAFIRSMVDSLAARLEEQPEDLDGWLRLVQARLVLGEKDQALAALRRAVPLVQDLPEDDQRRRAVEEGLDLL